MKEKTFLYSSFRLTHKLFTTWNSQGIISHIFPNGPKEHLNLQEAFELQLYLELHLLGLKIEAIERISSYLHRYSMDASIENIKNSTFEPTSIDKIIHDVKEGKICFLVIDLTGTIRVFQDEVFFMTFVKEGYLVDQSANIIISANKILRAVGYDTKQDRNTYIQKTLQKELEKRFKDKNTEVVYKNPKTTKVHELLKQPNRELRIHTNDV